MGAPQLRYPHQIHRHMYLIMGEAGGDFPTFLYQYKKGELRWRGGEVSIYIIYILKYLTVFNIYIIYWKPLLGPLPEGSPPSGSTPQRFPFPPSFITPLSPRKLSFRRAGNPFLLYKKFSIYILYIYFININIYVESERSVPFPTYFFILYKIKNFGSARPG